MEQTFKSLQIRVTGKVQGVFYRSNTEQAARKFGIKGWVKNLPDKSVSISAEGESEAIDKFLKWCHKGPLMARVNEVQTQQQELQHYEKFEVLK